MANYILLCLAMFVLTCSASPLKEDVLKTIKEALEEIERLEKGGAQVEPARGGAQVEPLKNGRHPMQDVVTGGGVKNGRHPMEDVVGGGQKNGRHPMEDLVTGGGQKNGRHPMEDLVTEGGQRNGRHPMDDLVTGLKVLVTGLKNGRHPVLTEQKNGNRPVGLGR